MPNPGLPADKNAPIQSSLEARVTPVAVAKLTNVPYNTVYTYHRKFRDFGELTTPKFAKLGPAKAMSVHVEDVSRQI